MKTTTYKKKIEFLKNEIVIYEQKINECNNALDNNPDSVSMDIISQNKYAYIASLQKCKNRIDSYENAIKFNELFLTTS